MAKTQIRASQQAMSASIVNALILDSTIALTKLAQDPLARANHTGSQAISTVTGLQTALDAKQASSEKGSANGYASLDSGGKVPSAQLPAIAISDTFVVASQAAQVALTAEVGDIAVRTDESKTYILKTAGAGTFANWELLQTPASAVSSVFGRTGAVTASSGDYTAAQVTNTPAGNIAASTVQAALNELDSEKAAVDSFITRAKPGSGITGDVDGTDGTDGNDEFTLANTPVTGSEQVFVNGILQDVGSGNDYTISGAVITFESGAIPISGDKLRVSYRK